MQKYTEFLSKIIKSSVLEKKVQIPNELSLKPGLPRKKAEYKNKQETKPNLIYIALHVLFCEIHIK